MFFLNILSLPQNLLLSGLSQRAWVLAVFEGPLFSLFSFYLTMQSSESVEWRCTGGKVP